MPLKKGRKKDLSSGEVRPYIKYGDKGKAYYFNPTNPQSVLTAKKRAIKQALRIGYEEARRKRRKNSKI